MCVGNSILITNTSVSFFFFPTSALPQNPSFLQPTVSLLLPAALQAVYNTAQPDVEQPDLSVQVVDFLFQ